MLEPYLLAQAADMAPAPPSSLSSTLTHDAMGITRVPGDIEALPFLQHLAEVMPAADVAFGGAMLMLIVVVHATGVRWVTGHVARRLRLVTLQPTIWRADVLMALSVLLLLALHLFEVVIWATSLVYGGLVPSWRAAGFFAGNTYTTVGYGNFVLPAGWEMLAPIIAISGLFTFGWSGSVLVDIVARCQKIKDAFTDQQAAPPAPPPAH
ncbi:MAG: ion channel [Betaproteobacteria bacterium]